MSQIQLLLLRHCESAFNADQTNRAPDVPLTLKGCREAQELTVPFNVSRVVCSPLRRCKDTLLLSELALIGKERVHVEPLCREHRTDACDFFIDEPVVFESVAEVVRRVDAFKELLRTRHRAAPQEDGFVWAVVSHADFLFYFTAVIGEDGDYYGQWLRNGESVVWTLAVPPSVKTTTQVAVVDETKKEEEEETKK
jgi:broad specificity phosphatase PhoE